jgi:hypothetical protein
VNPGLRGACALFFSASLLGVGACSSDPRPLAGADAAAPADLGSSADATSDGGFTDATTTDTGGGDVDGGDARDATATIDAGPTAGFVLRGRVSFDFVPNVEDAATGTVRLDYASTASRPARRVAVLARAGGVTVAETATDDDGRFALTVPDGRVVQLRVEARLVGARFTPDGIAPDGCTGGAADVRVVDNTQARALYALQPAETYAAAAEGLAIHAAITHGARGYTARAGAPFSLLDVALRELELVCSAEPSARFAPLVINWSINNVAVDGQVARGEIGTSYHDLEGGVSNVYVLGREDDDSDELDHHVVAHEVGHYLESSLYRSDSQGGSHEDLDVLDPNVAMSEGWGNAVSGMVWDDPLYIDTNGPGQADGFSFSVATPAEGNDRGVYSETAVEHVLWSLFVARPRAGHAGAFERIHAVLRGDFPMTPALTTVHSFGAYYNARFGGDAEGLRALWASALDTPYDALCAGACAGRGDTAEPFDRDNDVGRHYAAGGASPREYPAGSGARFDAEFWRQFRAIAVGLTSSNGHTRTVFGDYVAPDNKWGGVRYLLFEPSATGRFRVVIDQLRGGPACRDDVLDLFAYARGRELASDDSTSGCPDLSFDVTTVQPHVLLVQSLEEPVDAWATTVSRRKRGAPVRLSVLGDDHLRGGEVTLRARLTSRVPGAQLEARVRGLDGVEVLGGGAWSQGALAAKLRVPAERRGLVSVDVRWRLGDRVRHVTRALRVGSPQRPVPLASPGRLVDEADGPRVVLDAVRLPAARASE